MSQMELYTPGRAYIHTFTGRKFFYDNPLPCLSIQDIAHGLALNSRWSGQTKERYSIAQHSVLVSRQGSRYPLRKLLHDGSEAYTQDMNKILKQLVGAPFTVVEDRIQDAIWAKYGLGAMGEGEAADVKKADLEVALAESQQLLGVPLAVPGFWPARIEIGACWPSRYAEEAFLERFKELM